MPKLTTILSTLGVLAISTAAAAHSGRELAPGSLCRAWSSSEPTPSLYFSSAENPSTSQTLHMDCPLLHMYTGGINVGYVQVRDQHSSQNVTCKLCYGLFSGGSTSEVCETKSTAGEGDTWTWLSFNAVAGVPIWSPLYYSCTVPPDEGGRSAVAAYYVLES